MIHTQFYGFGAEAARKVLATLATGAKVGKAKEFIANMGEPNFKPFFRSTN